MTILAAASAIALVACGDVTAPTTESSSASAEASQATTLAVGAPGTAASGAGSDVSGYLALSAQTRRLQGSGAEASFSPTIAQPGYFDVRLGWPQALVDAGVVRAEVRHAAGTSVVDVDQRRDGGAWVSLGIWRLAPGSAVTLRRADGGAIYVDGLRLEPLGAEPPALAWTGPEAMLSSVGAPVDGPLPLRGPAPLKAVVAEGRLPDGLRLDGARVVGTPTAQSRRETVIVVTDGLGRTLRLPMTWLVEPAAPASVTASPQPRTDKRAAATSDGAAPDLSDLLSVVAAMPEGGWASVSLNRFSDVWAPDSLRVSYYQGVPAPWKLIAAWSGFAWDAKRARLFLYGGGHANYPGNDTYMWDAPTRRWQRASLPSEMLYHSPTNVRYPIDGTANAPSSAHTYDGNSYLAVADRYLVLGGAVNDSGGRFIAPLGDSFRVTGPYFFDPTRADANKVGGTTGSHVKRVAPYPEIVGGNMWQNREAQLNAAAGSTPISGALTNSCTTTVVEGGVDVAYVRTTSKLYRYTVSDVADPTTDRWDVVGTYGALGTGSKTTCGLDPVRRVLVSTGGTSGPVMLYWNLATLGTANAAVPFTPEDPSGEFAAFVAAKSPALTECGMKFDPVRRDYKLWCGDGRVWTMTPPEVLGPTGWRIARNPAPTTAAVPADGTGTGILGKWKYIPNLDVFLGLTNANEGRIWLYKPHGWVAPGGAVNAAPTVELLQPSSATTVAIGQTLTLSARGADADDGLTALELLVDGSVVARTTSASTLDFAWQASSVGGHTVAAASVDRAGRRTTSPSVSVTVEPATSTNRPPSVSLTSPVDGSAVVAGGTATFEASASDPDDGMAAVEFLVDGGVVGRVTAPPYRLAWTASGSGTRSVRAVAYDTLGASTASAAATIQVSSGAGSATEVTLRRGLGATAVADTFLSSYNPTTRYGASAYANDLGSRYAPLLRFAVFQSEGGPVPDGATIDSAVLWVHKSSSYDMTYALHRMLVPWSEADATWNHRLAGVAWAAPGAALSGGDYAAAPVATASIGFDPGWLQFDIAADLNVRGSGHHGWRLRGVSGSVSSLKRLDTSEQSTDAALRPRLVVSYH